MALLLHIVIALASLGLTAYVFFRPSAALLRLSLALIAGTLASGTFLLITKPSHMLETCVMGLFYIAVTSLGTVVARQRLATQMVRRDTTNKS